MCFILLYIYIYIYIYFFFFMYATGRGKYCDGAFYNLYENFTKIPIVLLISN
ncbi:hypothetical protein K6L59_03460 [Candidatus Phytoplasma sp. Tabriz.2]|nr:hypothetical protein [Candidatus Phytoplasma australiense]